MASLRRGILLWSAVGSAGLGCAESSGPSIASLTVVTATSGPEADPDGYTLRIDADRRESLNATDTLVVSGLVAGEHDLELQGVAPNCTVSGGRTLAVNASSRDSALVRFDVVCSGTVGTLQMATATQGADLDPSGYIARVNDSRALAIGANAVVSANLPTASYRVTLDGIAGNCALDGPNPREVALLGGGITRLEFTLHCSATAPAGRGHEIAFVRDAGLLNDSLRIDRLYVMNEDGTSVRLLPTISGATQRAPDWLSDGARLGFLAESQQCDFECARFYILTLSSGIAQPIPRSFGLGNARLSPDELLIAFGERSCDVDCEDPVTYGIVVADAEGPDQQLIASDSVDYFSPAWLADGTGVVYVRSADGLLDLARRSLDGSGETGIGRNFAGEFASLSDVAPSPDGSRVAFSARSIGQDFGMPTQVYVMGMDGSGPVALTGDPSNNFEPAWSPDSRRIAFVSDRDGDDEIYVMESDGANPIRLTNNRAHDAQPAWRP